MQEAVTVPPPACDVVREILSPVLVAQLEPPTLTAVGCEEHQVSGTPVMVMPWVSITVGTMLLPVPRGTMMLAPASPVTSSAMDCTGQVTKSKGTLLTLETLAKIEVIPGVTAVTWTSPGLSPLALVLTVATLAFWDCQVNTPTVGVISIRPLLASAKAVAW